MDEIKKIIREYKEKEIKLKEEVAKDFIEKNKINIPIGNDGYFDLLHLDDVEKLIEALLS